MRRIITTLLILLSNIIIQSTLLQFIKIRNILPNTSIIIIISFALLRGSYEGAIVGFFSGLIQDMLYGTSIGYYSLLGMLTGFFFGKFHHNFYRENYLLPLVLCSLGTLVYESIVFITGFVFQGDLNYIYYFGRLILPETVYTAIFSLFVYRILFSINEYLESKEKHMRKLF